MQGWLCPAHWWLCVVKGGRSPLLGLCLGLQRRTASPVGMGRHPLLAQDTITCCLISHSECAASLPSPSGARCMGTSAHKPALLLPAPSFGRGEAEPLLSKAVFLFVIFLLSFFPFSLEIKSKRKEESQPFSYSSPPPPH